MKIIFGGTFDPIHIGHIKLGLTVSKKFRHPVELMPLGGLPNYKAAPESSLENRLTMLKLVAEEYPQNFVINYSEANQPNYSPTYKTLEKIRLDYDKKLPLYFIIGGDSLLNLNTWDNWQELFSLTNFIVALRPDYQLENMSQKLKSVVLPRISKEINPISPSGQIILIDFEPVAISSTLIRRLCKDKQSIHDLVTPAVANYIYKHELYKGK